MTQWRWNTRYQSAATTATKTPEPPADNGNGHVPAPGWTGRDLSQVTQRLHQRLVRQLDPATLNDASGKRSREAVEAATRALIALEAPELSGEAKEEVITIIVDEIVGFGPIDPLIRDPNVSEIMVNGPNVVYYEREGRLYESTFHFRDADHVMRVIERIIAPLGRRVDESSPMVDARLPEGSRVNVIIPPLSPDSPTITIRKFRTDRFDLDDLIRIGTLTPQIVDFLRACVIAKVNTVISGGTGSGKTTLLNALSASLPPGERIVTIEDPLELKLRQRHVVRLEARPPGIEGRGEVTQRDLFRNSLRMRPDRIIVGEVRGAEAFDMLQAMNTGHEGSLTTLHANSPRDALARIENMVLLAGFDMPIVAIREQIASALHLIVQVSRLPDGSRRVTHVTEVAGMEAGTVTTQDIFRFVLTSASAGTSRGHYEATGVRPRFADRLQSYGFEMRPDTFLASRALT
jgi:pilus assembly protein CpaF